MSHDYSDVRALDRWVRDKFAHASLDDFLSAELRSGIHTIDPSGPPIDLHLRIRPSLPMVVFFNGNTPRDRVVELPAFSGLGILPGEAMVTRLCISDPTLHLSRDLCLSWYAGSRFQDLRSIIQRILARIIHVAQPSRVLFAGGSGGGFASLIHASSFPESLAFVWNPQTDIRRYNPEQVVHYAGTAFSRTASPEDAMALLSQKIQCAAAPLYGSRRNHLLYLQNASDWHTDAHLVPFLAELGLALDVERPRNGDRVELRPRDDLHVLLGSWGEGHVPPPKDIIAGLLRRLLESAKGWEEIFAHGDLSRMIAEAFDAAPAGV